MSCDLRPTKAITMNINQNNHDHFFFAVFLLLFAVFLPVSCRAQTASESTNKTESADKSSALQNCSSTKSKRDDLPPWEENPLHTAIVKRDMKMVKKLLAGNADVNEIAAFGDTPLGLALDLRIPEAKPVSLEKRRQTIADDKKFRLETISELFKYGADPNKKSLGGATPLTKALQINYESEHQLEILRLLIKNKADVNLSDDNGMNALILAAKDGRTEVVKFLLKNGADRNLKNCMGQTALMLAQAANQTEVIQLLQSDR